MLGKDWSILNIKEFSSIYKKIENIQTFKRSTFYKNVLKNGTIKCLIKTYESLKFESAEERILN